ncbi:hypothetical protein K443DRAFT_318823 [Laccaria amethystina LaAM-08-1]|uniref:Uncharacterized protein n=1 Tax=Laccaria amethystina LaAM-08-1 TaxID=1095629 RepID=A0A0C9Y719_9AGAR|nr:hypothetical protein K443DRAFT_318823 [Laccaria amethystina LaAM-08-1]
MRRQLGDMRRRLGGGRKRWRRGRRWLSRGSERYKRAKRRLQNWSKQLTNENKHSIREDPRLKNAFSGLNSSKRKWKRILLNLVVSTRSLRHLAHYSSSACRLSCVGRQNSSFLVLLLPSLSPVIQVLPTQILPLPPSLLNPSSKKTQT